MDNGEPDGAPADQRQPPMRRVTHNGSLKEAAVEVYIRGGAALLKARYPGLAVSSVRSWAVAQGCGRPLNKPGRPTRLTAVEEDVISRAVRSARGQGAPLDSHTVLHIANRVRAANPDVRATTLGIGWLRYNY